jgi:hypothetical protein
VREGTEGRQTVREEKGALVKIILDDESQTRLLSSEIRALATVILVMQGDHFEVLKHRYMLTSGSVPLRFHVDDLTYVLERKS